MQCFAQLSAPRLWERGTLGGRQAGMGTGPCPGLDPWGRILPGSLPAPLEAFLRKGDPTWEVQQRGWDQAGETKALLLCFPCPAELPEPMPARRQPCCHEVWGRLAAWSSPAPKRSSGVRRWGQQDGGFSRSIHGRSWWGGMRGRGVSG